MKDQTDTRIDEPTDEEYRRSRTRRLVRWIAVMSVAIVAILAVWQDSLG